MKVAIVHDWLTGMRGGEKCLEVFCELFPKADLYTLVYRPERLSPVIRSMNVRAAWFNALPGIECYYRYGLPLFPFAIERFSLRGYDLVLSSSHCVAKGVLPHGALHIAYVHAPMRYVWDQYDSYFGPESTLLPRLVMKMCRAYLQRWDVRSAKRVNHFIANSNNIAGKIRKFYGREAATIHPPVEFDRFYVEQKPEAYYLVVTALVPYKRVDLAIDAFNHLKLPLKVIGDGPLRAQLERRAGPTIQFLGWVEGAALARLYASCKGLVFPGEEDFGIVAVEAQASGRPVIAYGRGGVLESVNGLDPANSPNPMPPTGLFFDEPTAASLINAVQRFEQNIGCFDNAAIRAHAAKFSRANFKSQVAQFIAEKTGKKIQ